MGDFKINEKTVFTQSGGAEPAMGSTVTGIPAEGVTGVLPVAVTGGSGLTVLQQARNENLVVKRNTSATSTTVDIDADYLTLFNSSNIGYIASSINLSPIITGSGANGLDTGTEASSTWYHIWVIYNGTTVAGLLSTSATSPTMPSGYTYKKYVGAVYNNSSSNFVNFHQVGNVVSNDGAYNFLAGGTATGWTNITTVPMPPTTPIEARIWVHITYPGGGTDMQVSFASNTSQFHKVSVRLAAATSSGDLDGYVSIPVLDSQTIAYVNSSSSLNTWLYLAGWEYSGIV